jgi:tetratricopeptide (TPR) repeat protein
MNKTQISEKKFSNAINFIKLGKLDAAQEILHEMLSKGHTNAEIKSNLGVIEFKRGNYWEAYQIFLEIKEILKNDPDVLNRFALAAMHLQRYAEAESALKSAVESNPSHFDSWINLCTLAGFQGQDVKGLEYAMRAIAVRPTSAGAYVNLGACLQACNRMDDAEHAFETALLLDQNQLTAMINLGVIAGIKNQNEKAITYYDEVINRTGPSLVAKEKEAKFYKSISLLKIGQLREGWQLYDAGFYPSLPQGRTPKRTFAVAQWDGRPLSVDEPLLIWKEQGVGDELLFLSCLPEAELQAKNIIVECDHRLVSPLSRSFPGIRFRAQAFDKENNFSPLFNDFLFHCPIGSMFGMFRQDLSDFDRAKKIISPDTNLVDFYKRRIGATPGRLKVGICWRSGSLTTMRNLNYTSLSDWKDIFSCRDDIDFFNLQYGDFSEEVRNANKQFGIHINWWPDINYKDSFEDLFALSSLMDVVVTVGTAVTTIAASVGTPTILLAGKNWTSFGTEQYPAYPYVTLLQTSDDEPVSALIPKAADLLINL